MFIKDLRYALRLLLKKPRFAALTIFIMAAGISLSVYQFSFLNTLVHKPIPFEDGESVFIMSQVRDGLGAGSWIKLHDLEEVKSRLQGVCEFIAYKDRKISLSLSDTPLSVNGLYSEPGLFEITRTQPILGRSFTAEDSALGAEEVMVLGYQLWQNFAGGNPNIIGKKFKVNGVETRVIGVMPQGYEFPIEAHVWLPFKGDVEFIPRENSPGVGGIGHLSEGFTYEQVNEQLTQIMAEIAQRYPKTNRGISAKVESIPEMAVGNGSEVFITSLYIVATLFLLLAAVNVGNLMLASAIERKKETAIRVALGAPRARLVKQMLAESIIICCIGGVIGLLISGILLEDATKQLANMNEGNSLYWMQFGIDGFTIAIFFAFLIFTIFVTGFIPAWKASGGNVNATLRDGTRGAQGKNSSKLNRFLVISEVFLSMAVLIVAAVMVWGTYKAINADYGVTIEKKMLVNIQNPNNFSQSRIAHLAESLHASLSNNALFKQPVIGSAVPGGGSWAPLIAIDSHEYKEEQYPRANYVAMTPGFFKSLDVDLVSGRLLNENDNKKEASNIVVTESFANQHFPGESALGRKVWIVEINKEEPYWLTIVGVVRHVVYGFPGMEGADMGTIFRPFLQAPRHDMLVMFGYEAEQNTVEKALRNEVAKIEPNLAVSRVTTYEKLISNNSQALVFVSQVLLIFAVLALALASSGIYGVMSNTVLLKTQEIGVRRALGAQDWAISKAFIWLGVKQFSWGAIPGVLAGAAVGFGMTKMMDVDNAMLGLICTVIAIVVAAVVLLATYLPTRKALHMEPSQALRYE